MCTTGCQSLSGEIYGNAPCMRMAIITHFGIFDCGLLMCMHGKCAAPSPVRTVPKADDSGAGAVRPDTGPSGRRAWQASEFYLEIRERRPSPRFFRVCRNRRCLGNRRCGIYYRLSRWDQMLGSRQADGKRLYGPAPELCVYPIGDYFLRGKMLAILVIACPTRYQAPPPGFAIASSKARTAAFSSSSAAR